MKSGKGIAEAEIRAENDGRAVLPASLLRQLQAGPGSIVRVWATARSLGRDLLMRGITDEEIEWIGALQLEQRANVVPFLHLKEP